MGFNLIEELDEFYCFRKYFNTKYQTHETEIEIILFTIVYDNW